MKTNYTSVDCWPTKEQELLLKAALFSGAPCLSAWKAWKNNVDIEELDDGSQRLLPLAYRNLFRQGVKDPLMTRLKSVYRYMLAKNHLMFHSIIPILQSFENMGIPTMLLKGSALTILNYKNFGLRPQLDIDVLVPPNKAKEAVLYLLKIGWKPEYNYPIDKLLRFRHSCGFDGGAHKRLDLHWNIFLECREIDADTDFWERSVPVKLEGCKTRSLNASDLFLHTCIHGVKWNTIMPCRWVADAMTILGTTDRQIDWNEMIIQAKNRKLTLPLRESLHYLRDTFRASIPHEYIQKIDNVDVSLYETLEFRSMVKKKNKIFGNLFKFTFMYLRLPHYTNIFRRTSPLEN